MTGAWSVVSASKALGSWASETDDVVASLVRRALASLVRRARAQMDDRALLPLVRPLVQH
jgi:hypothetical protein